MKIPSKFEFFKDLYMDGYLEENRSLVNALRAEREELTKQLAAVEDQLSQFTSFKGRNVRLDDILHGAVAFLSTEASADSAAPFPRFTSETAVGLATTLAAVLEQQAAIVDEQLKRNPMVLCKLTYFICPS